jgi:glycosyl transferase family 4
MHLYAPEITGVGRYTGEIAEHLSARGASVTVITSPRHYPEWRVHKPFKNHRYTVEHRNRVKVVRCPLLLRENIRGVWRLIAPFSFALMSAPAAIWQAILMGPNIVICVEPTLFVAPVAILLAKLRMNVIRFSIVYYNPVRLTLLVGGASIEKAAESLGIAVNTARNQIKRVFEKPTLTVRDN